MNMKYIGRYIRTAMAVFSLPNLLIILLLLL